jgi:leucine-zipper of insertion element IS481
MMRIRTAAILLAFAGAFSLPAAGASAQTAPQGVRTARASQPAATEVSAQSRVRRTRWRLSPVFPRPQRRSGLQRDLCAGIPAERHGDRASHELLLAPRLDVTFQEVVHSAQAVNADVGKQQRFAEDRMDTHKNAPLTPKGREAMVRCVEGGLSKAAAARQFNTTPKTVAKWVERFRADGIDGLRDRSSRSPSLPSQTAPATCAAVEALRRQRYTGNQIAVEVGVSPATVSRTPVGRLGVDLFEVRAI